MGLWPGGDLVGGASCGPRVPAGSGISLAHSAPLPPSSPTQDAKLKYEDIDEVILVGGSTRIPAVQVRGMCGWAGGWAVCTCKCRLSY